MYPLKNEYNIGYKDRKFERTVDDFTECMPNLASIHVRYNDETVLKLFEKIETIRYRTYLLAFIRNNFITLDELPYNLEKELYNITDTHSISNGNIGDFMQHTDVLYKYLEDAISNELTKTSFMFPEHYSELNVKNFLTNNRNWLNSQIVHTDIFGAKYYNEIDNPDAVNELLDWLFDINKDIDENQNCYAISVYNFGDYTIYFKTKEQAEYFANFIECGTVREKKNGIWSNLYCFRKYDLYDKI